MFGVWQYLFYSTIMIMSTTQPRRCWHLRRHRSYRGSLAFVSARQAANSHRCGHTYLIGMRKRWRGRQRELTLSIQFDDTGDKLSTLSERIWSGLAQPIVEEGSFRGIGTRFAAAAAVSASAAAIATPALASVSMRWGSKGGYCPKCPEVCQMERNKVCSKGIFEFWVGDLSLMITSTVAGGSDVRPQHCRCRKNRCGE